MGSQIGLEDVALHPVVLELANDDRLETLRQRGDVLFDGKLCNVKDGGFTRVSIFDSNLPSFLNFVRKDTDNSFKEVLN